MTGQRAKRITDNVIPFGRAVELYKNLTAGYVSFMSEEDIIKSDQADG